MCSFSFVLTLFNKYCVDNLLILKFVRSLIVKNDICFFVNKGDKIGYENKFFPNEYYDLFTELNIDNFNYNVPLKSKEIIKYSYNIDL